MQISSLGSAAIRAIRPSKRRKDPKIPPWMHDVPPDQVDIRLMARPRRYGQSIPRFNKRFGAPETLYQQRASLYEVHKPDYMPPGMLSEEELQERLAELQKERQHYREKRIAQQRLVSGEIANYLEHTIEEPNAYVTEPTDDSVSLEPHESLEDHEDLPDELPDELKATIGALKGHTSPNVLGSLT